MLITGLQLKTIAPSLSLSKATRLADLHAVKCKLYGVETKTEFDEFLANITQESGEYSVMTENMNYRPERLAEVWPNDFATIILAKNSKGQDIRIVKPNALALKYARKPVELANFKYGSKYGNRPGTNDGFDFCGGGYIGLTFRDTYQQYTDFVNKRDKTNLTVNQVAKLVKSEEAWAMDSAYWFFYVLKSLKDEAQRNEWLKIVKSINGGYIGLRDRNMYLARVKKVLGT